MGKCEMSPKGRFEDKCYLFFDTEIFPWEGLPNITSLHDPARNRKEVEWVRSWHLVPDGGTP